MMAEKDELENEEKKNTAEYEQFNPAAGEEK